MIKLIIFDLDDTLIDTSSFKSYRDNKEFDKLHEYIESFIELFDAKEAIDSLIKKGIKVVILTSSPEQYATAVLKYFNLDYLDLYAYHKLNKLKTRYISLKTGQICSLKDDENLKNNEVIFVGDSFNDYKACEETNTMFITHKQSEAYSDFNEKILSVASYNELHMLIESLIVTEHKVYERKHENFGSFLTFSNYITDIYPQISHKDDINYSFDSMHKRIKDVKNKKGTKSLVNWLHLLNNISLKDRYPKVNYVTRALGSSELVINNNVITPLDIICFFIANIIGAEYKRDILTQLQSHIKLSESGEGHAGRKHLIENNYIAQNVSDKNILVIDDIVTTGATFEEILRAIRKDSINTNVYCCSIAQSVQYDSSKYIDNMNNSNYFHCGSMGFEEQKLYHLALVLYLNDILSDSDKVIEDSNHYITGILNIKNIIILENTSNYIYFSIKKGTSKLVIDSLKYHAFNDKEKCPLYGYNKDFFDDSIATFN